IVLASTYNYLGRQDDALTQAKLAHVAISNALKQDPQNDVWRIQQYYAYFNIMMFANYSTDLNKNFRPEHISIILKNDSSLQKSPQLKKVMAHFHLAAAKYFITNSNYKDAEKHIHYSSALFEQI
ncbi:hypothetical protein AB4511_23900, partial [Vibrio sp. 10N.222.54.F6]